MGAQETPAPTPQTVEDSATVVNATGKVVPQQYSQLTLSVPGLVEEVAVEAGEAVQAGDLLVRLKGAEDLTAAIRAAEFELAAARKAFDDLDTAASDDATASLALIAQRERELRDARYQLDNFTPPSAQAGMNAEEALTWAKERLDVAYAAFNPYRYYPENDETRKDRKEDYDDAQADYNAAIKRLEYETALRAAQNNLEDARSDYAIWQAGPDPKDATVAQARIDNAQAALEAAQARLDDVELRAPFAGVVSEVNVRVGEWVQPGSPGEYVVTLADLDHLRVETTDLNEIDAARVAAGAPVTVTFDALPGVEVQGVVKSIAPKASEGSGVNYTAIVELGEIPSLLRWGMTAFVDIEVGN
jgi:multidrug resistance efflux pump